IFGILANPAADLIPEARPATGTGSWWRWMAPATGLALMVLAAPRIQGEYYGERARVALRDSMYPETLAYAEKALSFEERNPDLYYYLGESQHFLALLSKDSRESKRLHEAAVTAFQKGLELFPEDLRL